jgi:hypothetical protein
MVRRDHPSAAGFAHIDSHWERSAMWIVARGPSRRRASAAMPSLISSPVTRAPRSSTASASAAAPKPASSTRLSRTSNQRQHGRPFIQRVGGIRLVVGGVGSRELIVHGMRDRPVHRVQVWHACRRCHRSGRMFRGKSAGQQSRRGARGGRDHTHRWWMLDRSRVASRARTRDDRCVSSTLARHRQLDRSSIKVCATKCKVAVKSSAAVARA